MRKFNPRVSLLLDRATIGRERGSRFWRYVKRLVEWYVFG